MKSFVVVALLVSSSAVVLGRPQYNYQQPSGPRPSYGSNSQNSGSAYEPSGAATGGQGNYAAGGPLQVECKRQEVSPGNFKFVCEGVNKDSITLRSEHILWLQNEGGKQQVLDIEVPNYKIDELIKAGFKTTPGGGTQVNVLLKKPEQSYDAEVDIPSVEGGVPTVNLQYEPVDKTVVHFPNDKQYRPLSGPILPPPNQ